MGWRERDLSVQFSSSKAQDLDETISSQNHTHSPAEVQVLLYASIILLHSPALEPETVTKLKLVKKVGLFIRLERDSLEKVVEGRTLKILLSIVDNQDHRAPFPTDSSS